MKKEDLKASLGKIKPREELINSTLMKMSEKRERKEKKSLLFTPIFAMGLKLAGACCTFVLVFILGLTVLNDNRTPAVDTSIYRTLAEIDTSDATTPSIHTATFIPEDKAPNGWIMVIGDVKSFTVSDSNENDKSGGEICRGVVEFVADKIIVRSKNLSIDLSETSTDISAYVTFYDEGSSNKFADMTSGKMVVCITPCENGKWRVLDFDEYTE